MPTFMREGERALVCISLQQGQWMTDWPIYSIKLDILVF